jgi:hypothetical protein
MSEDKSALFWSVGRQKHAFLGCRKTKARFSGVSEGKSALFWGDTYRINSEITPTGPMGL